MSYSFELNATTPKNFKQFFSALGYPDLLCSELVGDDSEPGGVSDFPDQEWPNALLHFYRDLISTRGVEVDHKNGKFSVRFLSLCSQEDYELGFKILEALASTGDGRVQPEDSDSISIADLPKQYNAEWIHQLTDSGMRAVWAMVEKGNSVAVPCIRREVHFGPRLKKEILEGTPEKVLERFMEKIRGVQYLEKVRTASVLSVKPQTGGKAAQVCVLTIRANAVFSPVDYITIEAKPNVYIQIPFGKLTEIAPNHCVVIDEKQILVRTFSNQEWNTMLARAIPIQVFPFGGDPQANKKWWEFWR